MIQMKNSRLTRTNFAEVLINQFESIVRIRVDFKPTAVKSMDKNPWDFIARCLETGKYTPNNLTRAVRNILQF